MLMMTASFAFPGFYMAPPNFCCDECDSEIFKCSNIGKHYYYLGDNVDICSECWKKPESTFKGYWKERIPDDYRSKARICLIESTNSLYGETDISKNYRCLSGIIYNGFMHPENERFSYTMFKTKSGVYV